MITPEAFAAMAADMRRIREILETVTMTYDPELGTERRRYDVDRLAACVKTEFGVSVARELIRDFGGAERLADIPRKNFVTFCREAEKLLEAKASAPTITMDD